MTTLVVTTQIFVHNHTTPVDRSNGIATEWMESKIEWLMDSSSLAKEHILASQYSLRSYIVGEHTLPTAWQSTSVEDTLNAITISIYQDILIKLHGLLLVASKEVNLDALDTNLLQPLELTIASQRSIQTVAWSLWCIVPITI